MKHKKHQLHLEEQLDGMVVLQLRSDDTETILQALSAQNIPLYRVTRGKDKLYLTINLHDFKRTQRLLRDNRWRFRICEKHGVPFYISRIKRRTGLCVGLLCAVLLGHFLLSFMWQYEVTGNEYYSDEHIVALVQQYGLWPGTSMAEVDYEALEHEMELAHPEFTWIQLEQKGTTLCISVKERLADDAEIYDSGSIVAKADGRITELLTYRGTALVERGDWVTKGQVLVGGWDYPNRVRNQLGEFVDVGQPYAVHAECEVWGETEHRAISTCALEEQWLQPTGNSDTGLTIYWGSHRLFSWGAQQSPYLYSEDITEQKSLFRWGKWYSPLVLRKVMYQEQVVMHRSFTQEEAYHTAVERARRQLEEQLPEQGKFVRESYGIHRTTQSGLIQAEVVWIVEEPMGQMMQVSLPEEITMKTDEEKEK